jgi:hypothetical protein
LSPPYQPESGRFAIRFRVSTTGTVSPARTWTTPRAGWYSNPFVASIVASPAGSVTTKRPSACA